MNNSLLSQKLAALRKNANYTQTFIADIIGVARQTYSHYETGRLVPNLEILYAIADLYQIPAEPLVKLLLPASFQKSPTTSDNFLDFLENPLNRSRYKGCTIKEKKLLYYFTKLKSKDQDRFIEIAKIMSE